MSDDLIHKYKCACGEPATVFMQLRSDPSCSNGQQAPFIYGFCETILLPESPEEVRSAYYHPRHILGGLTRISAEEALMATEVFEYRYFAYAGATGPQGTQESPGITGPIGNKKQ
jgi:hypothetical protein